MNGVLSLIVFSLVVDLDVNCVGYTFGVQDWQERNSEEDGDEAIHHDHEHILELEHEVTHSVTLEKDHWEDQWKSEDTDGEEGIGHSTIDLVVASRVLQFDDVHSSDGIDVGPDVLVSVDEHGNQETEKKDLEYVNEDQDEDLSLGLFVL